MLCEAVAVERNRTDKSGDDDAWEVRRPKVLGVEVQGQPHGSFLQKTFSRAEVLGCICVASFQTHYYKYN